MADHDRATRMRRLGHALFVPLSVGQSHVMVGLKLAKFLMQTLIHSVEAINCQSEQLPLVPVENPSKIEQFPVGRPCLGYLTVGPVFCLGSDVENQEALTGTTNDAEKSGLAGLKWLDTQPVSSVLYICICSWVPMYARQAQKLAQALEASSQRFLWLSFLKTITSGVPVLTWPQAAEQHLNARCLVDVLHMAVIISEKRGDATQQHIAPQILGRPLQEKDSLIAREEFVEAIDRFNRDHTLKMNAQHLKTKAEAAVDRTKLCKLCKGWRSGSRKQRLDGDMQIASLLYSTEYTSDLVHLQVFCGSSHRS
ncbi:hypothetical protein AXG93_3020s1010 [Marchantia polymorpha subsp. ruderalis]|uniref:Uncharacterized protein n=1 Tax=Marchantia polymorpha subsp. ruderalis TaxID=1480154 RepID=A0A176WAW7_MARPO|nr:hypothetical protein AXG93_3020s1010 [Marchantia polymorpha subsp. ruderalis]